ncbi:hypothetical protein EV13_1870 [Prochlorococcus sp. MIT 0702]|nr:hypothetical protein EV13_1870 [Prochlorococcus sp. MIT 0702]KGG29630.1 hypothetical protein EV12_0039 [Prochlorococcus sp. MIT 0701]KGG34369.1 hypothetical protein EV14_1265 [Prochlorococcus sp. MIT 0703]
MKKKSGRERLYPISNLCSGVCWIVNGQPEEESKTKNAKDSKDRS